MGAGRPTQMAAVPAAHARWPARRRSRSRSPIARHSWSPVACRAWSVVFLPASGCRLLVTCHCARRGVEGGGVRGASPMVACRSRPHVASRSLPVAPHWSPVAVAVAVPVPVADRSSLMVTGRLPRMVGRLPACQWLPVALHLLFATHGCSSLATRPHGRLSLTTACRIPLTAGRSPLVTGPPVPVAGSAPMLRAAARPPHMTAASGPLVMRRRWPNTRRLPPAACPSPCRLLPPTGRWSHMAGCLPPIAGTRHLLRMAGRALHTHHRTHIAPHTSPHTHRPTWPAACHLLYMDRCLLHTAHCISSIADGHCSCPVACHWSHAARRRSLAASRLRIKLPSHHPRVSCVSCTMPHVLYLVHRALSHAILLPCRLHILAKKTLQNAPHTPFTRSRPSVVFAQGRFVSHFLSYA